MTKDIYTIAEVVDLAYEAFGVYGRTAVQKFPTGIEPLDRRMGGIASGRLWALGARTNVGKTSILLNIAYASAKAGYNVGFISLEDGPSIIGGKFQSRFSGIPLLELERDGSSFGGLSGVRNALENARSLPIRLGFARYHSLETLRDLCGELLGGENPASLLCVDYLTALVPGGRNEPRGFYNEVLSYLRGLILDTGTPIILGSQLTRRPNVVTDSYEPSMRELAETGGLENKADLVMLAWADEDGQRYLKVTKNKVSGNYKPRMKIIHNINTEVMEFEEVI